MKGLKFKPQFKCGPFIEQSSADDALPEIQNLIRLEQTTSSSSIKTKNNQLIVDIFIGQNAVGQVTGDVVYIVYTVDLNFF